jgi:hypothetical protein
MKCLLIFLSRHVHELEIFRQDLPLLQQQDSFCRAVILFLKKQKLPDDKHKASFVQNFAQTCFIENNILWKRILRFDLPIRSVIVVPRDLFPP